MPSLTSWTRLEPTAPHEDPALDEGNAARIYDPLWMLTRQWQVGEFQGEDVGTPIIARWRGRVAPISRYLAAPLMAGEPVSEGIPYDPAIPLEAQVERQPLRRTPAQPSLAGLRFAVESGQQFLRILKLQSMSSDHSDRMRQAYLVPALADEERIGVDPDTLAYADLVAGRALDGRRLRAAIGRASNPRVEARLDLPEGDIAEVERALRLWLEWGDTVFIEPGEEPPCWRHDRFEYAFSIAARLDEDVESGRTLTARQYDDGTLDWYAFDLNTRARLKTTASEAGKFVTRTVIPAPVTVHGAPAPRFWEFEDPAIDIGALEYGLNELAQLLLVEVMTGYGNDWFVVPIDLPVGSLVESRSLVVTDTFGVRTLIRPVGEIGSPGWSMFSLSDASDLTGVSVPNLFFLPPTLARPFEGQVLEEVAIIRDEMANLAWAIERRLENPMEEGRKTASEEVVPMGEPSPPREVPAYTLSTAVPKHWIPLLPTQVSEGSDEVRLTRGAVLDFADKPQPIPAQARLLGVGELEGRLNIPEEEAPREGLVLRRSYQAARWHDGSLHVWAGNRASIGTGEGSSGLEFDVLES